MNARISTKAQPHYGFYAFAFSGSSIRSSIQQSQDVLWLLCPQNSMISGRLSLTASNSRFCSRHHSTAFDKASPARQVQRMSLLPLRFHSWRYSISAWLGWPSSGHLLQQRVPSKSTAIVWKSNIFLLFMAYSREGICCFDSILAMVFRLMPVADASSFWVMPRSALASTSLQFEFVQCFCFFILQMIQFLKKWGNSNNIFHRLTCNAKDVTIKERWRCILWEKQQH